MITSVCQLEVFNLSYGLAMDIFHKSRNFPKEEKYSLTDQIIRASRSIAANIAEGWGKHVYENEFKKHLVYSIGSLEESKAWLLFARDCGYITAEVYSDFEKRCDELGGKLYRLYQNWKSL